MDELALINWSPKEEQWAKINIIDFDFTPTLNAFLRGFFNWSFHDFKCQIRGNAKVTKCQFLCLALPFFSEQLINYILPGLFLIQNSSSFPRLWHITLQLIWNTSLFIFLSLLLSWTRETKLYGLLLEAVDRFFHTNCFLFDITYPQQFTRRTSVLQSPWGKVY